MTPPAFAMGSRHVRGFAEPSAPRIRGRADLGPAGLDLACFAHAAIRNR